MNASQSRAASLLMRATRSVIEQLEERRLMSAGAPDTTFGTGGQTITDFNGAVDDGHVLAQQSTGETVVLAGQDASYHLIRYDTHGNLESGFDVTPDVTRPRAMIVQSDDKILVLGTAIGANGTSDMAVERFNANGTLDSAFGIRTVDFTDTVGGESGDENGWGLAMDGSNIIVAGTTNFGGSDYAAVARISSDGATITTGEVDVNAPGMEVLGVAVQANGGIVVAGADADTDSNFAVARFTPALQIDPNFGDSGMAQIAYGNAVSVATDGNDIVIDGHSYDLDGNTVGGVGSDVATVMKLDGATGAQVWRTDLDFGGFNADAQGIAIQADHKVLVGGMEFSFENIGFIARLNGDGSMDNSFGSSGISSVSAPSGYSDTGIESVAVQSDGNIVGSGFATKFDSENAANLDSDVLVERLMGDTVVPPPNHAPVIDSVSITPSSPATNDTVTANVTSHDDDGDAVSYSYKWFNNNVLISGQTGSTLDLSVAGNGDKGDSITVQVTPNDGTTDGSAVTSSAVTVANTGPVGNSDSYSTNEDTTLTADAAHGVLANDSDADHDSLTVNLVGTTGHGDLTLNADGSFTYKPEANYHGPDAFQYSVTDGSATSGPISVSINVASVNDAPVTANDTYTIQSGAQLSVDAAHGVLANDTDVDGDALTAQKVTSSAGATVVVNSDGSFTYTSAAGFTGVDTFTYKASDGTTSTNGTVSITVSAAPPANRAPVANAGPDQKVDEDLPVLFNGTGSTDADGDTLTYSWNFGDTHTATGATPTHAFANSGTYVVTLTVNDGHGGVSTDTMSVQVLSPQEAINDIISEVTALHNAGDLNSGNTNALMTKLNGAVTKLSRDDYFAAEGQLAAFVVQVTAWTASGKISAADGQTLITSATNVMASIVLDVLT